MNPCKRCGVFHSRDVACFIVGQTARGSWGVQAAEPVTDEEIHALRESLRIEAQTAEGKAWDAVVAIRQDCAMALGYTRGPKGAKAAARERVAIAIASRKESK